MINKEIGDLICKKAYIVKKDETCYWNEVMYWKTFQKILQYHQNEGGQENESQGGESKR